MLRPEHLASDILSLLKTPRALAIGMKVGRDPQGMLFNDALILEAVDRAAEKVGRRFGAFVRRTARSSLKPARRKRLSEMTEKEIAEFEEYDAWLRTRGHRALRPRISSEPGKPPLIQWRPPSESPLKRIFFAYDPSSNSVVIGPKPYRNRGGRRRRRWGEGAGPVVSGAQALEYGSDKIRARPFMRPAYEAEKPKLEQMWRDSVKP